MSIIKVLAFSVIPHGSITWLGNKAHEEKFNKLYGMARRTACRAPYWASTEGLKPTIPDPELTISQWCLQINTKWYNKSKDKPAIARNIENLNLRNIPEAKIVLAKKYKGMHTVTPGGAV